ncbi:MAG TPA: nicotinamide-nucleotide amidohydrolase family protein [Cyclobacteriaceae bacterium]|nr:nicotinamide-nucleotide amidohydrolase family protein [Cyclobacteriaceae bacterium]
MESRISNLDIIAKTLVDREETIAIAESVTAGNLQAAFSLAKNATEFYHGGITVYNTAQKARHLHVDPIAADRTNCVSESVSTTMAREVCSLFSSNWGIAITGYAAPVPEWNVRNTLFAWYAIALNGQVLMSKKIEVGKMPMDKVQKYFTRTVLKDFAKFLSTARYS